MVKTCHLCGERRSILDMATAQSGTTRAWLCHPYKSTAQTCYIKFACFGVRPSTCESSDPLPARTQKLDAAADWASSQS
jgi:hypothetical protein